MDGTRFDISPLTPVLVTHGCEDHALAFTAVEEIASGLPNAQLYAFEGKGHLWQSLAR
jgi:hypothetical protein